VSEYEYALTNEWNGARERLSLLEALWDPWTIRNFEKLGIEEGWHCLEIAGGGGSIAEWLCRQVGSGGHVVATDLEPRFLEAINEPNLEVWRHDILRQPLPEGKFDLVHARALLAFLPEPAETMAKIVAAVKPGGWLLVESADFVSAIPDPSMSPAAVALSKKGWDAVLWHLRAQGYDPAFGRHLYHDVAMNGLGDLQAEGFVAMQIGGAPFARFWKITLEQVQDYVLEAGRLTLAELEAYRLLLGGPEYRWLAPTMMSVWGRRIAASGTVPTFPTHGKVV
jgi:ubiquinone/menaquinone biosynthesis C-methylase UbiE